MKKTAVILVLLGIAGIFSGCKKEKEILFDNTVPLALAPDVEWAVVIDPYAAYRESTDWSSAVLSHCRKGDILQVEGKARAGGKEQWYNFAYGWLPASAVEIYSNRLRAQTAAGQLK